MPGRVSSGFFRLRIRFSSDFLVLLPNMQGIKRLNFQITTKLYENPKSLKVVYLGSQVVIGHAVFCHSAARRAFMCCYGEILP